MRIGYVGDASFAEEEGFNEFTGEPEPHRSQGRRIIIFASPELVEGTDVFFHVLGYTSSVLRRVVRSTIQAETYNIQYAVESGDIIRAGLADIFGRLDHMDWEAIAAAFMHAEFFTDCESARAALMRPVHGKMAAKRLGIEVASLRQSLWRSPGETVGVPHIDEKRPTETTDSIHWIDTDIMLADPLTKAMTGEKLIEAMRTNKWNLSQPIESLAKKRIKQAQRSAAKKEENFKKGVKAEPVDARYGYKPEDIIADDLEGLPTVQQYGWIVQDRPRNLNPLYLEDIESCDEEG